MNTKNKLTNISIIFLLILILTGSWIVSSYNNVIQMDENVNEKYAYVQTAYQRRADLIPNLVEVVKGYATHEDKVFTQVALARSAVMNAQNPAELDKAGNFLTNTLKSLFSVTENYPELKANENFLALQDELVGTENRIKTERDIYNTAVKEYNIETRKFPTNIIVLGFGFDKKVMFSADPNSQKAVKIDFNS